MNIFKWLFGRKKPSPQPTNASCCWKSPTTDLTGLTWDQAYSLARNKGERIAHIQWEKDEFAFHSPSLHCMVKVKNGLQEIGWIPAWTERNSGNAWAVIKKK